MKVARSGNFHELQNLTVNIALEGDFDAIHTDGDNSKCLPTDTMKNTVYALAGQTDEIESVETFGQRLASHLLENNEQISRVRLDLVEHGWKRMKFDGKLHDHAFVRGSGEKRTATIDATREGVTVESGVDDLIVLKTTRSGFVGFIRDEYTTLPEATDRILSTAIKATWRYGVLVPRMKMFFGLSVTRSLRCSPDMTACRFSTHFTQWERPFWNGSARLMR